MYWKWWFKVSRASSIDWSSNQPPDRCCCKQAGCNDNCDKGTLPTLLEWWCRSQAESVNAISSSNENKLKSSIELLLITPDLHNRPEFSKTKRKSLGRFTTSSCLLVGQHHPQVMAAWHKLFFRRVKMALNCSSLNPVVSEVNQI